MTTNRKNELIAQLVNILSELIEANDPEQVSKVKSDAVEMLTVKECTEAVKGLSEHTIRKLIKQGKLPYLRTGDGVNGKMLINKADLLAYFNGQTANRISLYAENGDFTLFERQQTEKPQTPQNKGHRFGHTPEKTKRYIKLLDIQPNARYD